MTAEKKLDANDVAVLQAKNQAIENANAKMDDAKKDLVLALCGFVRTKKYLEAKYNLPADRWSYDSSGHIYTYASKGKKVRK